MSLLPRFGRFAYNIESFTILEKTQEHAESPVNNYQIIDRANPAFPGGSCNHPDEVMPGSGAQSGWIHTMENYIIRIYHRDKKKKHLLAGVVESISTLRKYSFENIDEFQNIFLHEVLQADKKVALNPEKKK